MNNKAFTLVELLATISLLAIISLIAVPSVLTITTSNKNKAYINDAKRFAADAESYMLKNPSNKTKILLSDINDEGLFSPDDIEYDNTKSCYIDNGSVKEVCLTNGSKSVFCSINDLDSEEAIDRCIKQGSVCDGRC